MIPKQTNQCLQAQLELPGGGGTPLAAGLRMGGEVACGAFRKGLSLDRGAAPDVPQLAADPRADDPQPESPEN